MFYEFIYKLKALPTKLEKKEALLNCREEEFKVIEHIFLNKNAVSKEDFKAFFKTADVITLDKAVQTSTVYEYIYGYNVSSNIVLQAIYKFFLVMNMTSSDKDIRMAARVLFQEEKLGLRVRDIKEIKEKRKNKNI